MENEAWDGTIAKIVKIIDAIGHDETKEEEVFQTPCIGKCTVPSTPSNATQITTQSTPIRTTSA